MAISNSANHASNNFDLMRLGFASFVLLSHAIELVDGDRSREPLTRVFHTLTLGDFGVGCFFILSGFMISKSWAGDPRPLAFVKKRVLRIYPGFIVACLVSAIVFGAIGAAEPAAYLGALHPVGMLTKMAGLSSPGTPPTFVGSPYPEVNGSLWTIRYEFACYMLVLVLGFVGLLASKRATVALWLLLAATVVGSSGYYAITEAGAEAGGHTSTLLRLALLFLSGAVFYKTEFWRRRSLWMIAAAIALLVLGWTSKVSVDLAMATAGAYLLFTVGFAPIRHTGIRRLPDISYGVYLYGWPVEKTLIWLWPGTPAPLLIFALATPLTFALGFASWHIVEKRALALKNTRLRLMLPRLGRFARVSAAEPNEP